MTKGSPTAEKRRKTPENATDFEREQLRYFLSQGDLATTLATLNPSLAWLPVLSEMKLVQSEGQLTAWIERKFADVQAVRDVVANLRFFGPDTANFLDHRLNARADRLSPLLVKCWRLIIRHMQTARRGLLQSDWFDVAPRIRRGETSAYLLERLAEELRPKLRLGTRFSLEDAGDEVPEHPWQLMSIDYEVDDGITAEEVLSAWPKDSAAETDAKLLSKLTEALSAALEDATDVGVEGNEGYSTSDADVPSVAMHEQNTYRTGFHAIVRVLADLWERLTAKSSSLALRFVEDWRERPYPLMRRLALFACAAPVVSPEFAADLLIALPKGELFFTGSTVEVFRLIRSRWNEFPKTKQEIILHRLCEGPPRDWFRDNADTDKYIDRGRFDILAEMERGGFALGAEAEAVLQRIRARWPQWQLRPPAQAGFHVWHESGYRNPGGSEKLDGVPDVELVAESKRLAAAADLRDGDNWQALCLSDPDRALRGLDAAAGSGDWTPELWRQLLWAHKEYSAPRTEHRIAELLLEWPVDSFGNILPAASWWLNQHSKTLSDGVLWPLWDLLADAALAEAEESPDA